MSRVSRKAKVQTDSSCLEITLESLAVSKTQHSHTATVLNRAL